MAKIFYGNCKSVLSGDTLVVASPQSGAERVFSLAHVSGPHLKKEGDEPFAFQSREYLRNLAVGKPVQATVLYTVPSGREYGTIKIKDGPELPEALIEAGWLKVREDAGKKEDNEDILQRLEKLRDLESKAKNEDKGLWAGVGGVIEVQQDLGGPDFMKEWKGKTVDGVIERVLSGDRMLTRLLTSEKKHYQIMTLIAGVRTPATERTLPSTGQVQPAEEYGNEAKAYVEGRLLQRQIKVHIVGVSPQGQLITEIIHPRGNIAEFLLTDGLARCNDFHSTMLGEKMAALRAAETKAKSQRLRLHKNAVVKEAKESNLDMIVYKIIGADAIIVKNKAGTTEKRVNLSSVRGPRAGEASEAPFRDEAKEFLRKKLIGKHVRITVDGSKPETEGFEARDVATVTEKGKNINLQLVQEGWCSVIRHRKDDTDRAPNYDELLAAQEKAKEEGKGMWSGKPSKAKQYADASESVQKAKMQLATLQRQKKVPGVVDFCKSGSRFTILIPREGTKLTMVLGGIRAPRAPGRGAQDKGEPFGQEALDLANRRCNQRDCEVDIHDIDKVGGFIGELFVNKENFAKVLVEEGLASVHAFSAEKSGNATELFAAEKRAKEGKKGMWHDWEPEDEEAEAGPAEVSNGTAAVTAAIEKRPTDYRNVVITELDGNGRLKIQEIGSGTAALVSLMSKFRDFHIDPKNRTPIQGAPKAGDYVAAKFDEDGQWYRARIRSNDRTNKVAEVVYIDYGNTAKIPWGELRPMAQPEFSTQKLKAQASDASLSFIQLPTAPEYFKEARNFLLEATEGKELVANYEYVDAKDGNLAYVTIYDSKPTGAAAVKESLNRDIVRAGLAMVATKPKPWEKSKAFEPVIKDLMEAQEEAKKERSGMWEYGDIISDD